MLVGVECHNSSSLRDLLPSLLTYIPTTGVEGIGREREREGEGGGEREERV